MNRKTQYSAANMKYKCVKPETVKFDKPLSFSFNPMVQPSFTSFYKMTLNNLKDWSEQQDKFYKSLKHCQIHCCLEISSGGRLHHHGWILITNIVKFFLHTVKHLRDHGTYEIDHIGDEQKWKDYVWKMKKIMIMFCNNENMIYQHVTCEEKIEDQ